MPNIEPPPIWSGPRVVLLPNYALSHAGGILIESIVGFWL
jgi:hypothetical protein